MYPKFVSQLREEINSNMPKNIFKTKNLKFSGVFFLLFPFTFKKKVLKTVITVTYNLS